MPPKLILASTSAYRALALDQLGLSYTTQAPQADESPLPDEPADQLAQRLALAKANAIAQIQPTAVVIGADQVGFCQGRFLIKPGSSTAAVDQLQACRGQKAIFYSALAVYNPHTQNCLQQVVETHLTYRNLSDKQIERYVDLDKPFNCAGAFKIESLGIALFEEVQSQDPSALVGLPLIALVSMLDTCGIQVLA